MLRVVVFVGGLYVALLFRLVVVGCCRCFEMLFVFVFPFWCL